MTPPPPRDVDVIDLLSWLVGLDSTTGTAGERRTLDAVADWMRAAVGAEHVEVVGDDLGSRAALVAPSTDAPLLLIACHIDTVPVTAEADWAHPPRAAVRADGRLHGRGSSDMKSGLASAMRAVARGIGAGAAVALVVTIGEEAGCLGAPAAVDLLAGREVGAVIIPESTDNRIALGHRGALWLTASTAGVAAHGSTPERGVNAIEAMARVLVGTADLPLRRHPALGAESVNVGTIAGGVVPNIVPDRCTVEVDHRVVDADVAPLVRWWGDRVDDVDVALQLDPVWTDTGDAWVRSLPAEIAPDPVSYFTDASVLVGALPAGTPIVVWGPGDPTTVHRVDESVEIAAVRRANDLMDAVVDDWGAHRP